MTAGQGQPAGPHPGQPPGGQADQEPPLLAAPGQLDRTPPLAAMQRHLHLVRVDAEPLLGDQRDPAGQGGLQRGPDAVPVLVRLVQSVRMRRDHLPDQPDLEPCPQREQRQHVQPALAGIPGFLLVLLVPDGGPGHRGSRRAGQQPPAPAAARAALGRLLGRVDVIPAHRDLVRRAAGPEAQHGQVGRVPPPRPGDLDAAGLFPAQGDQHELRLEVGVARQPKLPASQRTACRLWPHGTRVSHGGRDVNHGPCSACPPRGVDPPDPPVPVTTGTSSGAAAWRGPWPTGRRPGPRPSPRGGPVAAPAGAGSRSPRRPGGSGPGGRRATGRRFP